MRLRVHCTPATPLPSEPASSLGLVHLHLVGAENPVTSSDLQVLVNETAEAVSSQWSDGRAGGRGSAACGRVLIE
jgi:hypothetical protein